MTDKTLYTVVATADFEVSYPHPITLRAGQRVRLGRQDDQWPAWIWTHTDDGNAGWAPLALMAREDGEVAVVREDYTARELSLRRGDRLTVTREHGGWLWARNEQGQEGWIPDYTVQKAEN